MRCGRPRRDGAPCGNRRPCRWHTTAVEHAWARSGYRYCSARLQHLNPQDGPSPAGGDGPDGGPDDDGEPMPRAV